MTIMDLSIVRIYIFNLMAMVNLFCIDIHLTCCENLLFFMFFRPARKVQYQSNVNIITFSSTIYDHDLYVAT